MIAAALGIALMAGTTALFLTGAEHNVTTGQSVEREQDQYVLLAADNSGAVIASSTSVRGVDRTGAEQWRTTEFPALYATCSPRCPAAVVSGDARNLNSFMAPDPDPLAVGGARAPRWMSQTDGKAAVLATSAEGLVYATDERGMASWQSGEGLLGNPGMRPGFLNWFPSSDESAGVAVVDSGEYRQTVWYATADGWRSRPEVGRSLSGFGCASQGARLWVNDTQSIRGVRRPPVEIEGEPGAAKFSACGFTRSGLVTALYRATPDGPSTTIRVVDVMSGRVTTERIVDGEYLLSTDVASDRFMLTGQQEARLYDDDGRDLRSISDVVAARFVRGGDIVVVDSRGEARWLR